MARLRAWSTIFSFVKYAPDKRIRRSLHASMLPSSYKGIAKYITAGLASQTWQRMAAWLTKYKSFLHVKALSTNLCETCPAMVTDNTLALEFLALVADEDKGRTRVDAACRAIEFLRKLIAVPALADDPRTAFLKRGVKRLNPHTPKGALAMPGVILVAIVASWGRSGTWWKRMVALILLSVFLGMLRMTAALGIPIGTVTWVNGFKELTNPRQLPTPHTGVLLMLPVRKTRQTQPSWVPLAAGKVTDMLSSHIVWMRTNAPSNTFLFPARKQAFSGVSKSWSPHPFNHMSTASMVTLMRQALTDACSLSASQASLFTAHSLRVGGINFLKQLGVPIQMRSEMADHQSLQSSRRYLRLLPAQQFDMLSRVFGSSNEQWV